MKLFYTTTFLMLLAITTNAAVFQESTSNTEKKSLTMKSEQQTVNIYNSNHGKWSSWGLVPDAKPDIYEVSIKNDAPVMVIFRSDTDSLKFNVAEGSSIDFYIEWENQLCHQRIIGKRHVPAANFTPAYQKANKGTIAIRIPKVYELVNVAMAVSRFGRANPNRIYQHSEYYQEVLKWFTPFQSSQFVRDIDSLMHQNPFNYAPLKMNANAFHFDEHGSIKRSEIFDRTGFSGQQSNHLLPFMEVMQDFADQSKFLDFYSSHQHVYDAQIEVYRDSINLPGMQDWLDHNFPDSNGFDFYHVVFSPLVSYHQSSTWFESNGFKELQPHVNFPYYRDLRRLLPLSDEAAYVYRGNIVFTELNHGYINPVSDNYHERILKASNHREYWVDEAKGPNYYSGIGLFNEYMNWGLVNLRIMDIVKPEEQQKLTDRVSRMMVKNRGFKQFVDFNDFLMDLYANKDEHTSIVDLYPKIISWFEERNKASLDIRTNTNH